jgi:hypothetical protein
MKYLCLTAFMFVGMFVWVLSCGDLATADTYTQSAHDVAKSVIMSYGPEYLSSARRLQRFKRCIEIGTLAVDRAVTWGNVPLDVEAYGSDTKRLSEDLQRIQRWVYGGGN